MDSGQVICRLWSILGPLVLKRALVLRFRARLGGSLLLGQPVHLAQLLHRHLPRRAFPAPAEFIDITLFNLPCLAASQYLYLVAWTLSTLQVIQLTSRTHDMDRVWCDSPCLLTAGALNQVHTSCRLWRAPGHGVQTYHRPWKALGRCKPSAGLEKHLDMEPKVRCAPNLGASSREGRPRSPIASATVGAASCAKHTYYSDQ